MRGNYLPVIFVRSKPGAPDRGWLTAGPLAIPVALGRGGIKANKREGDGSTPRGRFKLKRLWWRGDRHSRPRTFLPVRPIKPDDGWCETPSDRHYNQPVKLAASSKADRLARTDALYDFFIELEHNTRPRISGRGSAVFVHIARPGFAPTAGCVALEMKKFRRVLERVGPRTEIAIGTNARRLHRKD